MNARHDRGVTHEMLASMIGYHDTEETSRLIFAFEQGELFEPELLDQLISALGISRDVTELAWLSDWAELYHRWTRWIDEPIQQMVLLCRDDFDEGIPIRRRAPTLRIAERCTSRIARKVRSTAWMIYSRRIASQFDEQGRFVQRVEALPPKLGEPFVALGGFKVVGCSVFQPVGTLNQYRRYAKINRFAVTDYFTE